MKLFSFLTFKARNQKKLLKRSLLVFIAVLIMLAGISFAVYETTVAAPSSFPVNSLITIKKGQTLGEASQAMKKASVVQNANVLQWMVILLGSENQVVAGDYYFPKKIDTVQVAERITEGDFGVTPEAVTIPEGFTVKQIGARFKKTFPLFNEKEFLALATPQEGFLFPDTYDFYPNVTPKEVIQKMSQNFERRTKKIRAKLTQSNEGHSLRQIVIMASILQKEARTTESRRIISGILWHRLAIGMRLQVDAPFQYFLGKNTYELTQKDLHTDSPYNTYTHTGLPIGPICNPGLDSLEAAMNPVKTDYLFYFSDKEGKMYYSKTFKEHVAQQKKYLD